ncbi:MAG: LarC family nickel insertion protein [Clostridiales Family XIII bacterium]|jgi:uncharacterized protein (TIGR00299 family) protein|nr:LarC family nickel insertion protein [Clostridiales Family XIII bacterium]
MKILYFEAPDGISGDMTLGALIDLGADVAQIRAALDTFVPEPYSLVPRAFQRNGITGQNLEVLVAPASHEHRRHADIAALIEGSGLTARAKKYARDIFSVIAEAEARVHGTTPDAVAFHEVGAMDSIIDIVGTAVAVDLLGAERFFCGALHDGSGTILCQHGEIPVPVPAVLEMAQGAGLPIVIDADVETEMITPTGFGIIKGLGAQFEPHLGIVAERVGYGFGKRDTGRLGAVRVTLGTLYTEEQRQT